MSERTKQLAVTLGIETIGTGLRAAFKFLREKKREWQAFKLLSGKKTTRTPGAFGKPAQGFICSRRARKNVELVKRMMPA